MREATVLRKAQASSIVVPASDRSTQDAEETGLDSRSACLYREVQARQRLYNEILSQNFENVLCKFYNQFE